MTHRVLRYYRKDGRLREISNCKEVDSAKYVTDIVKDGARFKIYQSNGTALNLVEIIEQDDLAAQPYWIGEAE